MTQGIRIDQPIVDLRTGMPTDYFLRLFQGNNGILDTAETELAALLARQIIAGDGLDGGGPLSADVTLTAAVQEVLDQISTTQGVVLYRGAADWAALGVGTSGQVLQTNGAGANPSWVTPAVGAFRGALVYNSADLTAQNYSSSTALTWDSESYDTDSFHDTGSNTSRLTIPSGVSYARLSYCIVASNVNGGADCFSGISKNGSDLTIGGGWITNDTGSSTLPRVNGQSAVISVSATDYFEVTWQTTGDTSTTLAAYSWFAIEVIE